MKRKSLKSALIISVMLALSVVTGSAVPVFAAPATHEEKVDVLVSFTGKPGSAEKELINNAGGKVKRSYKIVPTISASVPKGKLDSLRRNPRVTSVEEDVTVQITGDSIPWGVDQIDAEVVHGQNTGQGVRVAILDTGIDLDHPDLHVAGSVSFDSYYGTVTGDDDNGHGTMVAGIVAALDNGIGIVGVAPGVELYSVKVLNRNGWGFGSDILSGIEWAVDNNMQIVNISFGGYMGWPSAMVAALEQAYYAGIVLVSGAGNMGDQGIVFAPARFESVIAVGATDQADIRAGFSCTGDGLELMAPGVNVQSTSLGGGYGTGSGTSFSTPHVTGVAALLIASGVTSSFRVRNILQRTARDLGPEGWDRAYGHGLVSAADAVAAASEGDGSSGPGGNGEGADKTSPTTMIGIEGLKGNDGWYRSEVTVKLTAIDNEGGSGIASTRYSLDNGSTWQNYREPFNLNGEGPITILAVSLDNAGNLERIPALENFKVDKTEPVVSITADPGVIWPSNRKQVMVSVLVASSAVDGLSGVDSFQLTVKDEYGLIEPVMEASFQSQVWLEAWRDGSDLDGRVYTISITAVDHAGNSSFAETQVIVPHDSGKQNLTNKAKGG